MLSSTAELEKSIETFNANHRRPFGDIQLNQSVDISNNPEGPWPSNEEYGVYVLVGEQYEILYIGKASINPIGYRMKVHFQKDWTPKQQCSDGCKYIITIEVPSEHRFEAPAIEEYLLFNLKTKSNVQGKRTEY